MQLTLRAISLAAIAIGAAKIWTHVQSGAVLTLQGCQGRIFEIPMGETSVHCWGCYLAVAGAIGFAASFTKSHGLIAIRRRIK